MEKDLVSRRAFLAATASSLAGAFGVAWGLNNLRNSRQNTGVAQAAEKLVATATATPQSTATRNPEKRTSTPRPVVTEVTPQGQSVEMAKKRDLKNWYETRLRLDREEMNLFAKIDANVVILPLDESSDFKIDINGEQLAPAVSLIKTWVLLHGIFKNPGKEETVNGTNAREMMVNSNNYSTIDYILENAASSETALDEINVFLNQAMGLSGYVGITNWTYPNRPTLRSHTPLEKKYVSDPRLVGVDNPTTLNDMVQTLAVIESEEGVNGVAQRAWNLGYGQDHYASFEQYLGDVKQALTAAKTLMSQRCTEPGTETEMEQAIDAARFPESSEFDYGKGGTIGNLVEGWNRGRYVTEMRVVTLKRGHIVKRYAVAYSAWSYKTEKFLNDALAYMIEMTNASK